MEPTASGLTDTSWSPYAVGIGIGILSWLSFLISGKPRWVVVVPAAALIIIMLVWIEKAGL